MVQSQQLVIEPQQQAFVGGKCVGVCGAGESCQKNQ